MDGFPFVHVERVRFADIDVMGHVNNAVFLTYLEEARFAFLRHLDLVEAVDEPGIILARAEIDFRAPAAGDEVSVGVRASRLGTKSFDLEYEVRADERTLAEARTVQVAYDYDQRRTIALPARWRERLAAEQTVEAA